MAIQRRHYGRDQWRFRQGAIKIQLITHQLSNSLEGLRPPEGIRRVFGAGVARMNRSNAQAGIGKVKDSGIHAAPYEMRILAHLDVRKVVPLPYAFEIRERVPPYPWLSGRCISVLKGRIRIRI